MPVQERHASLSRDPRIERNSRRTFPPFAKHRVVELDVPRQHASVIRKRGGWIKIVLARTKASNRKIRHLVHTHSWSSRLTETGSDAMAVRTDKFTLSDLVLDCLQVRTATHESAHA